MHFRTLGRSGLKVSEIAFGTGTFTSLAADAIDVARRQVDIALDAGINLFDTADAYSAGVSEQVLGLSLAGRRDQALVATKVRAATGDGPNDEGLSRHHVISSCEASLRRLGTDHIDLYQLHAWDGLTPVDETLDALNCLVRAGKVRYVGVSNFSGWHLLKTVGAARRFASTPVVSQQIHYSLYTRDAESELVPASIDTGMGILVWSPLGGGLLSGRYRRDHEPPAGSRPLADWQEPPVPDPERLLDIVEVTSRIARDLGCRPADVALAWTLGRPGVSSVICGASRPEQLASNVRASEIVLPPEAARALDDVSRIDLRYPYWHQSRTILSRLSAADAALLQQHDDQPA